MDRTVMRRAGQAVKPQVTAMLRDRWPGLRMVELGEPDHPPHATLELAESLPAELADIDVLVSFGSGTITDLAKHAAFLSGQSGRARPRWVCCPTACTVTAYSSAMSVLMIDGVKRTIPSCQPNVILADLQLVNKVDYILFYLYIQLHKWKRLNHR